MQDNLLQQGFELMLYGMVFVFVLLLVLIAVICLVSAIMRYFPEAESAVVNVRARANIAKPAQGMPDAQTLSAIKAAISQHRARD